MGPLLEELQRRRVPQVAGIYLVAAWGMVEVADTTFPRLGLPDWTVTFLLVLLILGLPVALVLAWFYDLTRSGVRRTPAVDAAESSAGAGPSSRAGPAIRGRIAVVAAVVVLALGAASWVAFRSSGAPVEEGTVAVLPFRASGELSHLREGMVDLLSTKLSGDFGPRAVDQRVTLRAWREAGHGEDLVPDEAAEVARRVGASHVLTGEVVPAGGSVTISATLTPVAAPLRRPIRASVTGPADSVLQLVDRVAADLLGQDAGLDRDRLASLTSTSLDAVVAYLEGQRSERAGQFEEAARRYGRALEIDSTFALAAFGQRIALGWVDQRDDFRRAARLAWEHRHRLSRRDQALLRAALGPRGPGSASPIDERMRAVEEAIRLAPENPLARGQLADDLVHEGYRLEGAWPARDAMRHLVETAELDPRNTGPLLHIIELAAREGDTASVRSYYDRYVSESGLETTSSVPPGYTAALALQDPALMARFEPRLGSMQGTQTGWMSSAAIFAALPLDGYRELFRRALRDAAPTVDREPALRRLVALDIADGRFSSARPLLDELRATPNRSMVGYHAGVVLDGDSAYARQWLEQDLADPRVPEQRRALLACLLARYRAERGDSLGVRAVAAVAIGTLAAPDGDGDRVACGLGIEAILAVLDGGSGAPAAITRLDAFASQTPGVGTRAVWILLAGRLWNEIDRPEEALDVARRLGITAAVVPVAWLLHARVAARLGLEDEAIRMYRLYLQRRDTAEPGTRAFDNLEAARQELAAITGERRS